MKPKSYWKKRSEQIAARQYRKADAYVSNLRKEYDRAIRSIKQDVESFYGRYADNNQVSLAEARKSLTAVELKEHRMTLEEFTAKAKDNADGRWTKELNNAYYKVRVSRFEALEMQIGQHVEMLIGSRQVGTGELLGDAYTDTYYRTTHQIQTGTGIGTSFARVDQAGLEKVLGTKLDGRNWSQRIWDDRSKLRQELHTTLARGFIRGDSEDRMSRDLAKKMDVSFARAQALVQTETAFFAEQAMMDSYQKSGIIQKYEVMVTLDDSTCPICGPMDRKVFNLSEMETGVTYPPFHTRCRCTTVPWFEDEFDTGERIARGKDGSTYYVPGDTTYEEWEQQQLTANNKDDDTGNTTPFSAQNVGEAEEYAKAHLGFENVEYSGLDIQSAVTLNKSMFDVMEKYPEIKGFAKTIKAVDTDEFVAQASLSFTRNKLESGLKISTQYYNSADIDDIIKRSVEHKFWPPGSNKESIFAHEFGHLLEYAHAVKSVGAWVGDVVSNDKAQLISSRLQLGSLSKEIKRRALANLGLKDTPEMIKNELSQYAVTNSKEFLAEAFAEAEGTENPRKLAVETVRLLKEKLKEVGLL